ncbi:hypothetical protein PN462_07030 [Spirulina sp. CS-785/01]|uniref:hypothetical protein n=1 Tax=Spirulina sp. CS-785/01 TaxID=3021716 RepID=UPI00232FA897|nr:hypothetical protein [Spirulina sp. CS-785/01]MDB9312849.1 hypothetical protein [Spirulina sp. CS-785/01]
MKLFEHPDFSDLVNAATAHFSHLSLTEPFKDCDRISQESFSKGYITPPQTFAESPAIVPNTNLNRKLQTTYQQQCKILCYGEYPQWEEIQKQLQTLNI